MRQAAEEMRSTGAKALTCVLLAAALWSTGGLFIKWTQLDALTVSFGRSSFAAITLALVTRKEGFRINRLHALAAVGYAGMLLLFVSATKLTTAANAIFLQYTGPIYVLLLEPWLYRERFRPADGVAVLACVGGMSLFFVGKLRPEDVLGNSLALGSGLCFAIYVLLLRHPRAREVNRAASALYGNIFLAIALSPFAARALPHVRGTDVMAIAYLGIVQIGLAYALFTAGMARGVRSLEASLLSFVEPVFNPLWVFLFLGERPSSWALLGGGIIVAAIALHALWQARAQHDSPRGPVRTSAGREPEC